jgi:hypothetical protein
MMTDINRGTQFSVVRADIGITQPGALVVIALPYLISR